MWSAAAHELHSRPVQSGSETASYSACVLCRILAVVLITVVLGACGGGEEEASAPAGSTPVASAEPQTGHVHALGVDPGDGSIVVAAHSGLFRAASGAKRAERLGEERRDVMGFTIEGPGQYVGSGHPDPRAGGPPSVGFIRSSDGGRS